VPGRQLIVRLLALSLYLVGVAVALWLLDVRPLLVVAGMALALAIAWTIEWLAWRSGADLPRPAVEPPPAPPEPEPEPEPEPAPEREPAPASRPFLPLQRRVKEEREPVDAEAPPEPAPPVPEPEPPPEPEPEPEPEPPPRPELRPVPPPLPAPTPAPPPPRAPEVVPLPRSARPREWNLWDLERLAREEVKRDPSRRDEWSYLFVHLRQFASADGVLPSEFDPLVRESFGRLLERSPSA
jgi:hypothetical protein